MANQQHLNILKQGVDAWNAWRGRYPKVRPDLSEAELSETDLREANLFNANLRKANLFNAELSEIDLRKADLSGANLFKANLSGAELSRAYLIGAYLKEAHLSGANLKEAYLNGADLRGTHLNRACLIEADLSEANLSRANLSRANLSRANLNSSILVGTNLSSSTLTGCHIYGTSAWDVQLDKAEQLNLTITPEDQPTITVDNLKIAQFIYLLLNNAEIRDVINTLTTKAVLILGRFTPERKAVLDALRQALRTHGYLPILFDFEKPSSRSFTETVRTLAHLARFIIADLTDPSCIPQELQAIIPTLAVPVQPVLLEGKREYSMFVDFLNTYHWVLPIHYYIDQTNLLATLKEQVIEPAEQKAKELETR